MQLGYLSQKDYEDWRFGRISYLEKVCHVNLSKLSLINKSIRKNALAFGLKESFTVYKKWGKGAKQILRFSISGDKSIEEKYSTHYIDTKKIEQLKEKKAQEKIQETQTVNEEKNACQ